MSDKEQESEVQKERILQHAQISSDIKLTTHQVGKEEIIDEYCTRIAEALPHLNSLKKNELFRVLMTVLAPPFLVGSKTPWRPKNKKEEAICNHLFSLDDLKIALVEIIDLEREAKKDVKEKQKSEINE